MGIDTDPYQSVPGKDALAVAHTAQGEEPLMTQPGAFKLWPQSPRKDGRWICSLDAGLAKLALVSEVAHAWRLGNRVATARAGGPSLCPRFVSFCQVQVFPFLLPRPPKSTQWSFIRNYLHLQFTSIYTFFGLHAAWVGPGRSAIT